MNATTTNETPRNEKQRHALHNLQLINAQQPQQKECPPVKALPRPREQRRATRLGPDPWPIPAPRAHSAKWNFRRPIVRPATQTTTTLDHNNHTNNNDCARAVCASSKRPIATTPRAPFFAKMPLLTPSARAPTDMPPRASTRRGPAKVRPASANGSRTDNQI